MEVSEIRRRLKASGRTQGELATFLGVTEGHVSHLLSGNKRMALDLFRRIEAFLATAELAPTPRGVGETKSAFQHRPRFRSLTLEEARALAANPPPKPPAEERQRLLRELKELSEGYKLLPRTSDLTDDEILGYDEFGIPSR